MRFAARELQGDNNIVAQAICCQRVSGDVDLVTEVSTAEEQPFRFDTDEFQGLLPASTASLPLQPVRIPMNSEPVFVFYGL